MVFPALGVDRRVCLGGARVINLLVGSQVVVDSPTPNFLHNAVLIGRFFNWIHEFQLTVNQCYFRTHIEFVLGELMIKLNRSHG